MPNLSRRASQFVENTAESGYDAAVTIAARTRRAAFGFGDTSGESVLMVGEKVAAVCEGAVGAGLAWGTFVLASALRGGATPIDVSHAWFDMAEAAVQPAWRTVGANARRLSRKTP
jgi:predicted N-acetyltransferase YhbS